MLERSLVSVRVPALIRSIASNRGVILAYHNIVPDGEPPGGDSSLHLPRAEFSRQLDLLEETHRVVSLQEFFSMPVEGDECPRAAITFDDGYRGALTAGVRELEKRGFPATFFVSPGLLGVKGLWWDELAARPGGLPAELREEALGPHRGERDRVYEWAESRGFRRVRQPVHAGVVTEEELQEALPIPGVTLGAHGWEHRNLARLSRAEVRDEISRSVAWLGDYPTAGTWLSYPYGRSNPQVEEEARALGCGGTLRNAGGCASLPAESLYGVPRMNVPRGLSIEGFALRTAGL